LASRRAGAGISGSSTIGDARGPLPLRSPAAARRDSTTRPTNAGDGGVLELGEAQLAELRARDTLVATLDCTGGFYLRQRWKGVRLARLLERAGPLAPRAMCA
jgi:hypothetical protein